MIVSSIKAAPIVDPYELHKLEHQESAGGYVADHLPILEGSSLTTKASTTNARSSVHVWGSPHLDIVMGYSQQHGDILGAPTAVQDGHIISHHSHSHNHGALFGSPTRSPAPQRGTPQTSVIFVPDRLRWWRQRRLEEHAWLGRHDPVRLRGGRRAHSVPTRRRYTDLHTCVPTPCPSSYTNTPIYGSSPTVPSTNYMGDKLGVSVSAVSPVTPSSRATVFHHPACLALFLGGLRPELKYRLCEDACRAGKSTTTAAARLWDDTRPGRGRFFKPKGSRQVELPLPRMIGTTPQLKEHPSMFDLGTTALLTFEVYFYREQMRPLIRPRNGSSSTTPKQTETTSDASIPRLRRSKSVPVSEELGGLQKHDTRVFGGSLPPPPPSKVGLITTSLPVPVPQQGPAPSSPTSGLRSISAMGPLWPSVSSFGSAVGRRAASHHHAAGAAPCRASSAPPLPLSYRDVFRRHTQRRKRKAGGVVPPNTERTAGRRRLVMDAAFLGSPMFKSFASPTSGATPQMVETSPVAVVPPSSAHHRCVRIDSLQQCFVFHPLLDRVGAGAYSKVYAALPIFCGRAVCENGGLYRSPAIHVPSFSNCSVSSAVHSVALKVIPRSAELESLQSPQQADAVAVGRNFYGADGAAGVPKKNSAPLDRQAAGAMEQQEAACVERNTLRLRRLELQEVEREIKLLRQLRHTGCARYLGAFRTPSEYAIAMELHPCSINVRQYLELHGPPSEKRAALMLFQLLVTLVYLHEVFGVLHRDIKLENVVLSRIGESDDDEDEDESDSTLGGDLSSPTGGGRRSRKASSGTIVHRISHVLGEEVDSSEKGMNLLSGARHHRVQSWDVDKVPIPAPCGASPPQRRQRGNARCTGGSMNRTEASPHRMLKATLIDFGLARRTPQMPQNSSNSRGGLRPSPLLPPAPGRPPPYAKEVSKSVSLLVLESTLPKARESQLTPFGIHLGRSSRMGGGLWAGIDLQGMGYGAGEKRGPAEATSNGPSSRFLSASWTASALERCSPGTLPSPFRVAADGTPWRTSPVVGGSEFPAGPRLGLLGRSPNPGVSTPTRSQCSPFVFGVPSPGTSATQFLTGGHADVEAFLMSGRDPVSSDSLTLGVTGTLGNMSGPEHRMQCGRRRRGQTSMVFNSSLSGTMLHTEEDEEDEPLPDVEEELAMTSTQHHRKYFGPCSSVTSAARRSSVVAPSTEGDAEELDGAESTDLSGSGSSSEDDGSEDDEDDEEDTHHRHTHSGKHHHHKPKAEGVVAPPTPCSSPHGAHQESHQDPATTAMTQAAKGHNKKGGEEEYGMPIFVSPSMLRRSPSLPGGVSGDKPCDDVASGGATRLDSMPRPPPLPPRGRPPHSKVAGLTPPSCPPLLLTPCGTERYLPPEVLEWMLNNTTNPEAGPNSPPTNKRLVSLQEARQLDLYALGMVAHVLLSGFFPFNATSRVGQLQQQQQGPRCTSQHWAGVSPEAIDLVKQLLHPDPKRRLSSASEALKHPFFKGSRRRAVRLGLLPHADDEPVPDPNDLDPEASESDAEHRENLESTVGPTALAPPPTTILSSTSSTFSGGSPTSQRSPPRATSAAVASPLLHSESTHPFASTTISDPPEASIAAGQPVAPLSSIQPSTATMLAGAPGGDVKPPRVPLPLATPPAADEDDDEEDMFGKLYATMVT